MARNTYQKETVMTVLKSLRGEHPSAETVYVKVAGLIPTVSRATVYRILKQLAERGEILQIHVPESADRFDDRIAEHGHMVCTSCKKIVDIAAPHLEVKLPQDIAGCQITGVELIYSGICRMCSAQRSK